MSTKNRTAEQQPATSAFRQMIRQINIALEQKSGNFSAWVIEPAVGDNVRKEHVIN